MAAPPVLHITGAGRSGSTLLAFLLNAHPDMVSVGEVTGPKPPRPGSDGRRPEPEDYECSCGEPLARCRFWTAMYQRLGGDGIDFSPRHWDMTFELGSGRVWRHLLSRSLRSNAVDALRDGCVRAVPSWRARLDELGRRNAALAAAAVDHTKARVFVDASKDPLRVRYLERHAGLDVHALHLVRDAPGFVSSVLKTRWDTLDGAVVTWLRNQGHCRRLEDRIGSGRFLRMRYEDLCRDPTGELRRVTDWMGLPPMESPVRFRDVEHHVIGNTMRLESTSEVRVDESWRDRLTSEQIDTVIARTQPARRALGYA